VTGPDHQTDPDLDDPRPWEGSAAVPRDVAPHRAHLLRTLANVGFACGGAAVAFGVPAVVGLPLAVVTYTLENRDLDRMGGRRLDPRGRPETWAPCERAGQAITLNLLGPLACLVLWCGCLGVVRLFL
jgi:hypothetical protein